MTRMLTGLPHSPKEAHSTKIYSSQHFINAVKIVSCSAKSQQGEILKHTESNAFDGKCDGWSLSFIMHLQVP